MYTFVARFWRTGHRQNFVRSGGLCAGGDELTGIIIVMGPVGSSSSLTELDQIIGLLLVVAVEATHLFLQLCLYDAGEHEGALCNVLCHSLFHAPPCQAQICSHSSVIVE